MIRELVELAEKLRQRNGSSLTHDALKIEQVGIDCIVSAQGEFLSFQCFDKMPTVAEALSSKKGKARLLLDKCEEVLGIDGKPGSKEGFIRKHEAFLRKLNQFRHVVALTPVNLFYEIPESGIARAQKAFFDQVPEKKRTENIAFRLQGEGNRIHEHSSVYDELKLVNEESSSTNRGKKACSVCGSVQYPVDDIPHGMIKRVPAGQSSGCALVSYNQSAFESYGLKGNNNSAVCTHCAKAYVESLNWLMCNGAEIQNEKKKKPHFRHTNRKKISSDTAFVFWLKESVETDLLDLLESPTEDSIRKLIDSPFAGATHANIGGDAFYGVTLSGVAARIAVRDWMQASIPEIKKSLGQWFEDVAVFKGGSAAEPGRVIYPAIHSLVFACKRSTDTSEQVPGRIGAVLWRSAIKNTRLPLWLLSSVLGRLKAEQGKVTPERAGLIKLFLIRNKTIKGGRQYMEKLEGSNKETAYLCGRLFAVLERLQYHAQGEVNAGIGERFFTAASASPAVAFGRLLKLSKQHLSKLKGEKPGLAVNIDKEIQEIVSTVEVFPQTFRLEEQGLFALGYYHQKNSRIERTNN